MADEIPDGQKGLAGGLLSLGAPAAAAVAAVVVGVASLGEGARLAIVPLLSAVCIVPLLFSRPVPPRWQRPPPPPRSNAAISPSPGPPGCWSRSRQRPPALLLYYFESLAPTAPPVALAMWVGRLSAIAYLLPLPFALLAGRLSDRTGARKPFLFGRGDPGWRWACWALARRIAERGRGGVRALYYRLVGVPGASCRVRHAAAADPAASRARPGTAQPDHTLPALAGPLLAWWLTTPHGLRAGDAGADRP